MNSKAQLALSSAQPTLPFGVEAQAVGLVIPQTLSDEQIVALGQSLNGLHNASAWWLADYMLFVTDMVAKSKSRRIGKAIYEKVLRLWPSYHRPTLINRASVARRVPAGLRSAELTFEHHAQLAVLADEPEAQKLQAHYVRVAVEAEMTADELRMAIADTRRGVAHTIRPRHAAKALKAARPAEPDVPRGTIAPESTTESEDDGLPIPAIPREASALSGSHAELAAEGHRTLQRLNGWYAKERKSGSQWSDERKAQCAKELGPLMLSMAGLVEIYNGLTDAEGSGHYAGEQ